MNSFLGPNSSQTLGKCEIAKMFFGLKQRPEMRKISFPCRSLRILGYCLVFCDAQAARCRHDCVPRVLHPYSSPVGQWVGQSIFKESINYLILFFKKLIVLPIVLPEAFQNPQAGAGRFLPAAQVVKEPVLPARVTVQQRLKPLASENFPW